MLTYRLIGTTDQIGIYHDELDQSPPYQHGQQEQPAPNLRAPWCASKTAPRR